ncbi:MAG: amino acid permease [Anaerolineales bacterium]|nr:amino acid permease [Anaerolineales bacterium]
MSTEPDDFLGELRLGRRLMTVWQVAAGGLVIVLALALLVPGRVVDLVGTIGPITTLLAFLIMLFTVLNIIELIAGSSERGGSYTLIHETLGGLGGFLAGWATFAGYLVITASFIKTATMHLTLIFPLPGAIVILLSLGLLVGLVLIQLFRLLPRRDWLWPSLSLLFIAFGIFLVGLVINTDLSAGRAAVAFASNNFMRAAAWLFVGFAAVEAIMASRRQIRDPERHLSSGLFTALLFGGLLLVLFEFVAAGLPQPLAGVAAHDIASAIGVASALPEWIVYSTAIITLMLGANVSLVTGARQLNALSRQGALPDALRWLRPPFRVQPLLFGLILLLVMPLILWAPASWLMDLAAGFFLISAFLLNLAALISRRTEPDRRRALTVAFYPLVPVTALVLCASMWLALPGSGVLGSVVWLLLGLVIYGVYGRTHLIEAQEGVLVFRREPVREKQEGDYRILVPLSAGMERHRILEMAAAFARQLGGEVLPLQVISIADPLAITEGRRIARERNTLFQWSTREVAMSDVPVYPITRLARSISEGIIDTADEEQCDLILLSWLVRGQQQGVSMGQVLDPVVRLAPCDVVVVAFHPEAARGKVTPAVPERVEEVETAEAARGLQIGSILVPTAGGPHAPLATRLALLLAREFNATTNIVYVADPEASKEQLARGRMWIEKTITTMREQMATLPSGNGKHVDLASLPLKSRVVTADSVVEGIAQAGAESDLVFIGASEESFIDRVLFGTIPEQVARACPSPVLMVKRFRGLRRFWLQRVWDALFGAVPTLERQEQVEVYRQVRRGARPDVDFFIMIGLSSIIATLGLLQESAAVIIGAMLVAPLFTPILAFSLAIVQGDVRLLSLAVESAIKGIALAIGLSILLTTLSPLRVVTGEIAARTQPNLFDLVVALASGAAGAYAVARKDVATALPGVAIAAALVPPLGVVGIGLAMGDAGVAGGGGLLFITNLIAITLAGSVTLLLLGFRPSPGARREGHLRLGLVVSLLLLIAITIPLATVFVRSVEESRIRQTIDSTLRQHLPTSEAYELDDFEFQESGTMITVRVTIYAHQPLLPALAASTREELEQALDRPVRLEIRSVPIESIELPVP